MILLIIVDNDLLVVVLLTSPLVKKLQMYGIVGIELQWFRKLQLNNRKQFVSWNGSDSSYRKLTCGSILGPLLFIMYVNDSYLFSKNMFFIIFAGDTNMFMSNRNYEDLITYTNAEH